MIRARVTLTQPERNHRQFVAETGSGHHFLIDDNDGGTGPKPVELVAAGLAGCTAFDVINILRKKRQSVTAYDVFVAADQVRNTSGQQHAAARGAGRTESVDDHTSLFYRFPDDRQRIGKGRQEDDGSAVLIIVHDRDVE